MDDNQLLKALREIVQDETRKIVQEETSKLDAKINGVETRFDAKIDGVESRINAKIDRVNSELRTVVENTHNQMVQQLREDYGRVADAAAKGAAVAETYPETKGAVEILERAVEKHNERLTSLEKGAA